MVNFILYLFILLSSIEINGEIIDVNTNEELVGAEIKYNNKIYYTDFNGEFSIPYHINEKKIIINSISYNSDTVYITKKDLFFKKKIIKKLVRL